MISIVAASKTAVGIVSLIVSAVIGLDDITPRYWLLAAHAAAFGAAGVMLAAGGRADKRARLLGAAMLLVATTFSIKIATPLHQRVWPLVELTRGLLALRLDAFLPYLAWRFAHEFPRVSEAPRTRRLISVITGASFAIGAVFVAASVANGITITWPVLAEAWPSHTAQSARVLNARLYWPVVLGLTLAALPMIAWRAQRASVDERRRVRLLAAGLVAGTLPALGWILITATFTDGVKWLPLDVYGWLAYPALLSTPFTVAYAVLKRHALDVRLVAWSAIRYMLTRNAFVVMLSLPAVVLLALLYKDRPITSPGGILVFGLLLLGTASLRWRTPLLDAIDRHFFRPQYDAKQIISDVITRCARTDDPRELAEILCVGIKNGLAPESVNVLLRSPVTGQFIAPGGGADPLAGTSSLAAMLVASTQPIDIELDQPSEAVAALLVDDRQWLADLHVRLLVPFHQPRGHLLGFLTLGAKKSTNPYVAGDRALLQNAAAAAALAIVAQRVNSSGVQPVAFTAPTDRVAAECLGPCGRLYPPDAADCPVCEAGTTEAMVPQIVHGKFVVQQRIGSGGSGIVYRAVDTTLNRVVAIKTLRSFISPGESLLLQREAQSMAKVTHQNLATIYGAETWHGRPLLIVEYLAGGTLTDRLVEGPMPLLEAIDVVVALAVGLAEIHRNGLVHGDVKPSNIGFTATETVKLLDFGLARLTNVGGATDVPLLQPAHSMRSDWQGRSGDDSSWTGNSVLVGTPRYMSPETLSGAPPLPRDDVWSLAVVLYESLLGTTPFAEVRGVPVLSDERCDMRQLLPSAPNALVAVFRRCFSFSAAQRPQSADEFHAALRTLLVEDVRTQPITRLNRNDPLPRNPTNWRPPLAMITDHSASLSHVRKF